MLIAKMPNGESEIYSAFQGEGQTISKHCVFVRLAGCNLNCDFCDTAYSWLWEGRKESHRYSKPCKKEDVVMELTPEEVVEKIKEVAGKVRRVVFTGGEPMLQQRDIIKVLNKLNVTGEWCIELETNGTIEMNPDLVPCLDIVNCSPKLASSGNIEVIRNKPNAIKELVKNHGWYELIFKFVIHHDNLEEDMAEVIVWQEAYHIENNMVYLMPEGITEERIKEASLIIWKYAYNNGYKFSPRLQVMIYGVKRGV